MMLRSFPSNLAYAWLILFILGCQLAANGLAITLRLAGRRVSPKITRRKQSGTFRPHHASRSIEYGSMETDRTVLTDHVDIAEAIRRSVPNQVLVVDPRFIDLADPGFNSDFVPQFRIMNPKAEKTVRSLGGEVICALPPRIPISANILLYTAAFTLQSRPACLLYAPLHSLQPDAIKQALADAAKPDPWYITAMIAHRITERLIGLKIVPILRRAEIIHYTGWMSLYYLHIMASLAQPYWTRHILFGACQADEIDPFGGAVYHPRQPPLFKAEFSVVEREKDSELPDPRHILNHILTDVTAPLVDVFPQLEKAYLDGHCSWPFSYGGEVGAKIGEHPLKVMEQIGILQRVPKGTPAKRVVRLYEQDRHLFRSVSYYPADKGKPPVNEIPKTAKKADVRLVRTEHRPNSTLNELLGRLTGQDRNLDPSAVLKPLHNDFITQQDQAIGLTPKGRKILECLVKAGLTNRVFYLLLRALENIHLNESSYPDVMSQIAGTLNYNTDAAAKKGV